MGNTWRSRRFVHDQTQTMDDAITVCEARRGGLVLTADLRDLGVTTQQIRDSIGLRVLVPVRRGVFIRAARWAVLRPEERHRELVRSIRYTSGRDLTVCRWSAAVMHGLPVVGVVPDRVHALDPEVAGGSSNRFLASHRGEPEDPDSIVIDGVRVTSLARTATDLAIHSPMLASVPALDQVLRVADEALSEIGHWTSGPEREQLIELLDELAPRRGRRRAAESIGFADAHSMSVGESVSRVQMHRLGFAAPELQRRFILRRGRFADVDFWWRTVRAIGEFDGQIKYLDARFREGRAADEVVLREKQREDELRRQSDRFIRWDWACALDSARFGALLSASGIPRR